MASNAEDERVSELYDELKAAIESLDDAKVVKLADQSESMGPLQRRNR